MDARVILGLFVSMISNLEAGPEAVDLRSFQVMPNKTIFSPPDGSSLPSAIVGTLSTNEGFAALESSSDLPPCDWVEFRGDQLGVKPDRIFALSSNLRSRGINTIYTLRLKAEGGEIEQDNAPRFRSLCQALESVSAVDIEVASPFAADMVEAASRKGKGVILSSHNFSKTPDREDIMQAFKSSKGDHVLIKVAAQLQGRADMWKLVDILKAFSGRQACVMGMGEWGARSRIVLAALGSLFTYGYLDQSAASGQMSCEDLRAILHSLQE